MARLTIARLTMARLSRLFASWLLAAGVAIAFAPYDGSSARAAPDAGDRIVHTVTPSEADPAIRDFNDPNYAIFNRESGPSAPLVVYLSGTHGHPRDRPLLQVVAALGYRTLDLSYDDSPAVNPICPRSGDPECSGHFRADRVMGDSASQFTQTPAAETILNRLTRTLQYLDRTYPDEHWGDYLAGDQPNWSKIVVSGLSQGAGMAAMIAKHFPVARVVLFSAPADFIGNPRDLSGTRPAPWLSGPSATPPDRWYAEYNARERGAERLREAYAALGIPPDHIMVFKLGLSGQKREEADEDGGGGDGGGRRGGGNPYHGDTIKNLGYANQWRAMFGAAPR